jgi:SulP family sulfate permease
VTPVHLLDQAHLNLKVLESLAATSAILKKVPKSKGFSVSFIRNALPVLDDFRQMMIAPQKDVVAGLSVAVVALPLALAFGVSSGVGAAAGLTTALVAGFASALLGGSRIQVSGPTGAMTVVLIPVAAKFGISAVFAVGFLAGLILLFTGTARAMRLIPVSVIEGFTVGIALLIGLQQVPMALGTESKSSSVVFSAITSVSDWLDHPSITNLFIATTSALFILVMSRIRPGVPAGIATVVFATGALVAFDLQVAVVGNIPSNLQWQGMPNFAGIPLESLIIPAFSVAGLAAIEGLLCASVADSMAQLTPHNPHQELFGQSISNLLVPLFGGIPATAAIARTAVNVRSGAQSRLAAITHSIILFFCIFLASDVVSKIPLSVLAGVLIATALRMIEFKKLQAFIKQTSHHLVIVPSTAIATLFLDLVEAVAIGLFVAFLLSALQNRQQRLSNSLELLEIEQTLDEVVHPDDVK